MNFNLPSNLFYLKDNFTVEDISENSCGPLQGVNESGECVDFTPCERGKYRPRSGGDCENAPMSGDWGNIYERLIISGLLFIHAFSRVVMTWRGIRLIGWAGGYLFITIAGFCMLLGEWSFISEAEDREDEEEKEQKDLDAAAAAATAAKIAEIEAARLAAEQAGNETNTTETAFSQSVEAFTLSDKDYFGMETETTLFGLRLTNYIILAVTIGLSIFSIPTAV